LGIKDALDATRHEEELEVQTEWGSINNSVLEVADTVIKQHSKLKTKQGFNQKCAEVIELRNDSRLKMIQHPTQLNKDIFKKGGKKHIK